MEKNGAQEVTRLKEQVKIFEQSGLHMRTLNKVQIFELRF